MDETITVSLEHYVYLKKRNDWLSDLENAGVDNWSGYDYACELRRERVGDDEDEIV